MRLLDTLSLNKFQGKNNNKKNISVWILYPQDRNGRHLYPLFYESREKAEKILALTDYNKYFNPPVEKNILYGDIFELIDKVQLLMYSYKNVYISLKE